MRIFKLDELAVRSSIEFAVEAELALHESAVTPDGDPPPTIDERALGERLFALAAWSCLLEPGDSTAAELVAALGAARALELVVDRAAPERVLRALAEAASHAPAGEWIPGVDASAISEGIARWTPRLSSVPVLQALADARRGGLRLIVPASAAWPVALDDLGAHAPLCVWVRGDVRRLGGGAAYW